MGKMEDGGGPKNILGESGKIFKEFVRLLVAFSALFFGRGRWESFPAFAHGVGSGVRIVVIQGRRARLVCQLLPGFNQ